MSDIYLLIHSSTPSFIALVPGSGYWDISPGKVLTLPNGLGTGYTWRNPVPSTVNLVLIGGDNRGMGSGGFISNIVAPGDPSRDSNGNCLSTGSGSSSTSSVNVGAIAGGINNNNNNNNNNATYEPLYSQPISTPPPVPRQTPQQQPQEPVIGDSEAEVQPPAYTNQSDNAPVAVPVTINSQQQQQRTSLKDPSRPPAQTSASAGQPGPEVQENDGVGLGAMHLMWNGRG